TGARSAKTKKAATVAAKTSPKAIGLTIERCDTCTQYKSNLRRISTLTKELYPNADVNEVVISKSKSFEIYVSNEGSQDKKLIWSGKAHAPPKRLAFPDSSVYVDLLKTELKDK
ncbi:hypothetical protein BGX24_011296, partial [Mortierella sp. AD032]